MLTKRAAHAGWKNAAVTTPATHATAARAQQLGMAMGLPEPVAHEGLNIHQDGTQALNALRRIIDGAQHTLELSTFVFGRDVLGDEIAERLKQIARSGVRVRLLIDGIGIYIGGYPDLKGFAEAGVEVVRFVSPFRSPKRGRTNLRNHRKMVIADGLHLWCGGRNLAAEYFEGDPRPILGRKPWLDLSFDLRGELARQALHQFEQDWSLRPNARCLRIAILWCLHRPIRTLWRSWSPVALINLTTPFLPSWFRAALPRNGAFWRRLLLRA